MSYTLYDASIVAAKDILQALSDILTVGAASPQAANLVAARIHENMLPLSFQVHTTTDTAQKLLARTSGTEPLSFENNLSTFEEFQERIAKVQALLEKADKELINSRAGEIVTLGLGPGKSAQMPSSAYVSGYAMPNLYFHLSTAYNIMRKEGVELGKQNLSKAFMGRHLQ